MTRTARTLVVVGVATVTAGIAAFAVYNAIRNIPVREVEIATTYYAVAAKNLPTGSRLTAADIRLTAWPAKSPVPGGFTKVTDVVNRGLISSVVENEPLTENKLAPIESGAGLPPTIPEGMRAMSVRVDEVIGVAGFVVPGTKVDVVVTVRNAPGNSQPMSRIVLSDVLVLTAGTRLDQEQAKDGQPQRSTVVTLALTPHDAEKVALASSEGRISLALRNPLDVTPTQTNGIQVAALMSGGDQPAVPAPVAAARASGPSRRPAATQGVEAPPPPRPSVYTVEAIRAAKRSEEVVR